MQNEFTVILQKEGPWFIAWCAELLGANGQGKTKQECLQNLKEAIKLIFEDNREQSFKDLSPNASQEKIKIAV